MSKKTIYVCIEGGEGVGKTTQTQLLADHLREKGYKVLQTKEPGVDLLPLTIELRKIMLDAQYENQITPVAREFVSQAIRSIHLEKLIYPALAGDEYDYIIQDRGILSGLAYGTSCGNDPVWLENLATDVCGTRDPYMLYDKVIYLTGNIHSGLSRALDSKQEFEAGDAIEARGITFMEKVSANFQEMSQWFSADTINIDGKNIEEVFDEILSILPRND